MGSARSPFILDRSLTDLAYRCHPDGCPRGRTCCVGLTVEVNRREIRAIDTLMDELAELLPHLREGDEYANVFVDDPPSDFVIEAEDDGVCPFLHRTRTHSLCGVHTVALGTGRSVAAVKPAACRHWPVMLRAEGSRVRVMVQPHARKIGCVAPRAELPGKPSVLEAYREEILEMCGPEILSRLPGGSR